MAAPIDDFGVLICQNAEVQWCGSEFMTPVSYSGNSLACLAHAVCNAISAKYAIGIGNFFRIRAANGTDFRTALPVESPRVALPFSAQNLYDCVPRERFGMAARGCLDYIMRSGVHTLANYPFTEYNFLCYCKSDSINARKMTINGWRSIEGAAILEALREQPIVGRISFRSFNSITTDNPNEVLELSDLSDYGGIGHAVLVIGYGYDEDGLYYIIKNCWGLYWGFRGYLRVRPAVLSMFWSLGSLRWMEL